MKRQIKIAGLGIICILAIWSLIQSRLTGVPLINITAIRESIANHPILVGFVITAGIFSSVTALMIRKGWLPNPRRKNGVKVEVGSTLLLLALANWQSIPPTMWPGIIVVIIIIIFFVTILITKGTRWFR